MRKAATSAKRRWQNDPSDRRARIELEILQSLLRAHSIDELDSMATDLMSERSIFKEAMYSAREVEHILGASERTVRDLPLRWVRFGRGRMVLGEDLLRFVRNQR